MRALDRKLLRDLWHIKSQVVAISLVIAAGISVFTLFRTTLESLRLTQATYYQRYRFADIFAANKRAPLGLGEQIRKIPGVAQVETRVVVDVTLDVTGMIQPAVGRLISIPERRRSMLNDVFLRSGRYIEPGRGGEVLVNEGFALAHGLGPGDSVGAVINGRHRDLEIVGIALSPEYVYGIRPGDLFPDDRGFGVFWMGRKALATAFDMEGGFNNVALSLMPGAREEEVIDRLDRLLERYGGLGAIPRERQLSHFYLNNEITQLERRRFSRNDVEGRQRKRFRQRDCGTRGNDCSRATRSAEQAYGRGNQDGAERSAPVVPLSVTFRVPQPAELTRSGGP